MPDIRALQAATSASSASEVPSNRQRGELRRPRAPAMDRSAVPPGCRL